MLRTGCSNDNKDYISDFFSKKSRMLGFENFLQQSEMCADGKDLRKSILKLPFLALPPVLKFFRLFQQFTLHFEVKVV